MVLLQTLVRNLEKKQIRSEMKQLRNAMDDKQCDLYSTIITNSIKQFLCNVDAFQNILVYMHYQKEVRTNELIEFELASNNNVFVPKVNGKDMEFYQIFSMDDCERGYHDILEPRLLNTPFSNYFMHISKDETSIMILPGLGFDKSGNRVGYGGGYYDRYLSRCMPDLTIGICYDDQVVESIEADPFDIKVDYIVTEKQIIKCKG